MPTPTDTTEPTRPTIFDQLKDMVNGLHDTLTTLADLDPDDVDMDFDLEDEPNDETAAWIAFAEANDIDPDDEPNQAIDTWLNETPLEAYETGKCYAGGEWDATGWVVVFSTGGPHMEIEDGLISAWWGSDKYDRRLPENVGEWLSARIFGEIR